MRKFFISLLIGLLGLVGCTSPLEGDTSPLGSNTSIGGDFDTLSNAGNNSPSGIWSDGTTMWVLDNNDAKIYAYNLSTKARTASEDFNTLSNAGNNVPLR